MINQIGYQQLQHQRQAVSNLLAAQPIASYRERDPITGQRIVELVDGSVYRAEYLSGSEPAAIPQYQPGRSIGVPGFIGNR